MSLGRAVIDVHGNIDPFLADLERAKRETAAAKATLIVREKLDTSEAIASVRGLSDAEKAAAAARTALARSNAEAIRDLKAKYAELAVAERAAYAENTARSRAAAAATREVQRALNDAAKSAKGAAAETLNLSQVVRASLGPALLLAAGLTPALSGAAAAAGLLFAGLRNSADVKISLAGLKDNVSATLADAIDSALAKKPNGLIVALSKVDFLGSAGISVTWKSPFGPVKIDLGLPYMKTYYDRPQIIHFSTATGY